MGSNSNVILATAINEGYFGQAEGYLRSINEHSQVDNRLLTLDFYSHIRFANVKDWVVDSSKLRLPLNNFCLQHGEFVDFIPGDPDDVIIFTDADLRMQRPFSDGELRELRKLRPGQVMVGYNAGPRDTLEDEALRLGLKVPVRELWEYYGDLQLPCYNVGCVAARRDTWEKLCSMYVKMFPQTEAFFSHVARQQWLISWLIGQYFRPVEMPLSFHTHYHYGMPDGTYRATDGTVMFDGEPVLLRHKFDRA